MKGKALRRAIESADAIRVNVDIPAIVSTTELVTPDLAKDWLKQNVANRPINWRKVDEYAGMMMRGVWRLHDQGLMFDTAGCLITGQTRLWAVIKSGLNVYMRVSRGNPPDSATLVDRGVPQSARDLAARRSGRAYSPTEASLVRAVLVLSGDLRPSKDALAAAMAQYSASTVYALSQLKGQKKTRELLMIVAALIAHDESALAMRMVEVPILMDKLRVLLLPRSADECWGRGTAFSLAMENARRVVAK